MFNYFTTNSTSTPAEQPTLAPTTMASTSPSTDEDDSALSSPPHHIIHSPLPSRPSPTQPAHVLDALVRGTHAGSSASPAPTTESSTTSFSAHHHAPNSHSSTPQSFNHLQPAQAQPDRGIDLLAMLTNAANASQSQLSQFQLPQLPQITQPPLQPHQPHQSHPQPPRMPVDDPKIAGRMILDSLINSQVKNTSAPTSVSPPFQSLQNVQNDQEGNLLGPEPAPPFFFPNPSAGSLAPASAPPPLPSKSFFDSISPFDAFSNANPKRKPVPCIETIDPPRSASPVRDAITLVGSDTGVNSQAGSDTNKRKSIDLLEQLTRVNPLQHQNQNLNQFEPLQPTQLSPPSRPAASMSPPNPHTLPVPTPPNAIPVRPYQAPYQGVSPPPLRPAHTPIPQHSPPRTSQSSPAPPQRASPVPRKANGPKKTEGRKQQARNSAPPPQFFNLDVSQPLSAHLATPDRLNLTPIALLKLESIYVAGCTIGVSHWIAYAMTRGRVRLIARNNGARALLKLPHTFPTNSSIVDLVTSGNRLAGVTSDGGFVVWEVPQLVDDDIPSLLLVSVPPIESHPYKNVKWDPSNPNVLAIATQSEIHLINTKDLFARYGSESISQSTLLETADVFTVPNSSTIAAFAFDPARNALATLSSDSVLTMWNAANQQSFWSGKVHGEGQPSSLFFVESGVIIGRKRNTVVQLLPNSSTNILATLRFTTSEAIQDEKDFFSHIAYDSRLKILWAANSHRSSLMALKLNHEATSTLAAPSFEQVLDFPILHPTISLGILSPEAYELEEMERANQVSTNGAATGPTGAMMESIPTSGPVALIAYVIHTGGVDQILMVKRDLDLAISSAQAKLPLSSSPTSAALLAPSSGPARQHAGSPMRARTPLTDVDIEGGVETMVDPKEHKKGKPRRDKKGDKQQHQQHQQHQQYQSQHHPHQLPAAAPAPAPTVTSSSEASAPLGPTSVVSSSDGGSILREIHKIEENLQSRFSAVMSKEFREHQYRFEQSLVADRKYNDDFQDHLTKTFTSELTKSATRVLETTIKNEMQRTVLPALENLTRNEVKAALGSQIIKGINESINKSLPVEIEKLLLRPDVSSHMSRTFTAAVTPLIEKNVRDQIQKNLIPAYHQQASTMIEQLYTEISEEMVGLKKDIVAYQSETLKNHESLLHDMETSIRALTEQVKALSSQPPQNRTPGATTPQYYARASPVSGPAQVHMRQPGLPMPPPAAPAWQSGPSNLPRQDIGPIPMNNQGMNNQGMLYPMQSLSPPIPQQQMEEENWELIFINAMSGAPGASVLDLIEQCPIDKILPLQSRPLIPPSLILGLLAQLSTRVANGDQIEDASTCLWWLLRCAQVIDTTDSAVQSYLPKMGPNIQAQLRQAMQRFSHPQYQHQAQDILDIFSSKL